MVWGTTTMRTTVIPRKQQRVRLSTIVVMVSSLLAISVLWKASPSDEGRNEPVRRVEGKLRTSNTHDRASTQGSSALSTLVKKGKSMSSAATLTNPYNASRFSTKVPFLKALATCEDLECVHDAHFQPKPDGVFNYPHFIIIGFQKSATTSLFNYLATHHPQTIHPALKEPEFLSFACKYHPPARCPPKDTVNYIRQTLQMEDFLKHHGKKASFEASTHLVRSGDILSRPLHRLMPWLKLIVSLREPISRAASMLIHLKDLNGEGCLGTNPLGWCLMYESQINGSLSGARTTNYSFPMRSWLQEWPKEQIHVVQYEELTEEQNEAAELRRVKNFLGINPDKPSYIGLGLVNSRKFTIRPEGWPMRREEYEGLIELVRPDVDALLDVLDQYGQLRDRAAWFKRWQDVWESNLGSCDENGNCNILLS